MRIGNEENIDVASQNKDIIHEIEEDERKEYGDPNKIKWQFIEELKQRGFQIEYFYRAEALMPRYKDVIVPLVIKYYNRATEKIEKDMLIRLLYYKGLDEAVPFLIEKLNDSEVDKWRICDCLYEIRSKKYINEYLRIIGDSSLGSSRH